MTDRIGRGGGKAIFVIPTTLHPVRVVSLKAIGSTGRSAVLLNGTTSQANISNSYNDFVKTSTGLVNRLFDAPNSPSYRLDISDRIEAGLSWNLSILAAHAWKAAARELAPTIQDAERLVWATGAINAVHLSVERVGDISKKLRNSKELFEAALAHGLEVDVFLPVGTEEDVDDDVAAMLGALRIAPIFVSRVDELLAKLSLPALPRAATEEAGKAQAWKGNPYRGLEPYLQEHRAIFFGRAKAREEAAERLRVAEARARPFLLVHGTSGVGKSSFVQAGLAGDLEARLGTGRKLSVATVTPSGGMSPTAALAGALGSLDRATQTNAVADADSNDADLSGTGGRRAKRLLIVDQLEELFAATVSQAERDGFADLMEKTVRSGTTYVVATMRSDGLDFLDQVPALARLARDERLYRLERPNRREFGEIIASPAVLAGYAFPDQDVPDALVERAMASSHSLPLLQAVLFRLFEQSDEKGRLTMLDLSRLGGFEGVVGRWADEVSAEIIADGASDEDLNQVLTSLVRIGRDTGRPHARTVGFDPASMEGRILRHLANGRLVGLSDSSAGPQARLAHEVLITHWERLADLVRRLPAAVALRDELEERARIWVDRNRDEAELLRGASQLESVKQLKAGRLVRLGCREIEFIEASLKQEKRRIILNVTSLFASISLTVSAIMVSWMAGAIGMTGDVITSAVIAFPIFIVSVGIYIFSKFTKNKPLLRTITYVFAMIFIPVLVGFSVFFVWIFADRVIEAGITRKVFIERMESIEKCMSFIKPGT